MLSTAQYCCVQGQGELLVEVEEEELRLLMGEGQFTWLGVIRSLMSLVGLFMVSFGNADGVSGGSSCLHLCISKERWLPFYF